MPPLASIDVTPGAGLVHAELVGGDTIYCGGFEGRIHAFSTLSLASVGTPLAGHAQAVNCIRAFGTHQLLSCGSDGYVRLWDRETSSQVLQIQASSNWLWSLCVHDGDGSSRFSVGGVDYCMRTFDIRAPVRPTAFFLHGGEVSGMTAMLEDVLLTTCFDGHLRVFEHRALDRALHTRVLSPDHRLTRVAATEKAAFAGSFGGQVFNIKWD